MRPEKPMAIHFTSCADAYAHGYANIHKGQPGYRIGLDRDHDNVACDQPPAGFTPHPSTTPHSTPPTTPTISHSSASTPGGGPQLPLTGPGEAVGGGLVLALVGVAIVTASRRRKRKFIA